MAAGSGESVFNFGKPSYDMDKMYQRYLGGDCTNPDEADDDVFRPDAFIFPGEAGDMDPASFFTPALSYTCFLGRFQLFPLSHCCGPGIRSPEQEDKATQTHCPSSPSEDVMLPFGVTKEPTRLFYGNAGYRLHFPGSLQPNACHRGGLHRGQHETSSEVQIARKLQCIGDQLYRCHVERVRLNRNHIWHQIFLFFRNLALNA